MGIVHLVRHGQASFGSADYDVLSPEGEEQAIYVAERLAVEPLAGLFITPLRRTAQTAEPLATVLGVQPVVVPDLREVFLGDYEGGVYRIKTAEGDPTVKQVFEQEAWSAIPNAETFEHFGPRITRGVEEMVRQTGPDKAAVAVLHGAVIGQLCRQATDARAFAFVHADNCSVSRLVVQPDGRWLLRSFNDIAHLRVRNTA